MSRLIKSLFLLLLTGSFTQGQELAPFVIPLDQHPDSEIRYNYQPLSEADRLSIDGEKFVIENGRQVRIWGVNMSFAANFPTHDDAGRLARRLAGAGMNSVRFHHMDTSKWPNGIWDDSGQKFHPEAIDRLDYFIDQLAKCGIYSNINLHVGKEHSADLGINHPEDRELRYDKMISIFTPEIIDAQRQYAKSLLTHKNKYRDVRYADDYAVGFVEITNENSLFMWSAAATLPNLPEYYAGVLQKQYNLWLEKKYANNTKLLEKWLGHKEPFGDNILKNSELKIENGQVSCWTLEQHEQGRAILSNAAWSEKRCLEIKPQNIDDVEWHLQFNYKNLKVRDGQNYTICFEAASPEPRELYVFVNENHADWQNLGLSKAIKLDKKWKKYEISFAANKNDNNARISFSFGKDKTRFYLSNIIMQTGVEYKMGQNESLDKMTVKLYSEIESPIRKKDRMIFFAETEKAFFDGMYKYIKEDLGCKANITGTIVFGPLGLWAQSGMDYIDSHAYWKHPNFPGKPWDSGNWIVEQLAMSEGFDGSTLVELASERLAAKPYTVSEYNHPAPLDSQAECVPMIASWAARQDWSGIWLYTYSHSNSQWDRNYMYSFFDIDSNPGKWGFIRSGASAFRMSALDKYDLPRKFKLDQTGSPILESLASAHIRNDRNMKALFTSDMTTEIAGRDRWQKGTYIISDDDCGVFTGNMSSLNNMPDEKSTFEINIEYPEKASISIAPVFNKSAYLITACGRCENVNMKFSDDRNTVGRNWGNGPAQIETVKGAIKFKKTDLSNYKCFALYPDGTIRNELEIEQGTIRLDPKHKTMWYLLKKNEISGYR